MRKLFLISLIGIKSLLIACGGSDGSDNLNGGNIDETAARVILTVDDLPECNSISDGLLFYIVSLEEFQYCDGSDYQIINLSNQDVIDDQNGTDGQDGLSSTNIVVRDANNTFLGYSIGLDMVKYILLSENNYTYELEIEDNGSIEVDIYNIKYKDASCSGQIFVRAGSVFVSKQAVRGRFPDSLYYVTDAATYSYCDPCYDLNSTLGCNLSGSDYVVPVLPISYEDAGIPTEINAPLKFILE
ncbi:hypothetical protein ACFL20_11110 [Spirochaetota bacterium]